MDVSTAISEVFELLAQSNPTGTPGGSNFTQTQVLASLNRNHRTLCVKRGLGIVEQKCITTPGVYEYDLPTPDTNTAVASPQATRKFLAVSSLIWLQPTVFAVVPKIKQKNQDELRGIIASYPLTQSFPYDEIWWANRFPKKGYIIFPCPASVNPATTSPLVIRFMASPVVLTATDVEATILLPDMYHDAWVRFSAADLLNTIDDDTAARYRVEAETDISSIASKINAVVVSPRKVTPRTSSWKPKGY